MKSHYPVFSLVFALACLPVVSAKAQGTAVDKINKAAAKAVKVTKKAAVKAVRTTAATAKNIAVTPIWPSLAGEYKFDTEAVPAMKAADYGKADYLLTKLSFTGPSGKPVEGVYLRPRTGTHFACVLALHGLTQSKEIAVSDFGKRLVKSGVAVLALDAPGHGKQRVKGKNLWQEGVIRTGVHDGVMNYRFALTYLLTRPEVDKTRIGLVGLSMGAITGAILGGVDERISAFALCVGGDALLPAARVMPPGARRNATFAVSPSLYVGHIAPRPLLMINGKADPIIVAPAAILLHQNAQAPKEVVWFNGTHDVPPAMKQKAVDWLVEKLKAAPSDGGEKPAAPQPDPNAPAPEKPAPDPSKPEEPQTPAPPRLLTAGRWKGRG